MPTDHPNTPAAIAEMLPECVFDLAEKPAGSALIGGAPSDWWELHHPDDDRLLARVVVTLEDGIEVYAFVGQSVLAWEARLSSSTPLHVLEALVEATFADGAAQVHAEDDAEAVR